MPRTFEVNSVHTVRVVVRSVANQKVVTRLRGQVRSLIPTVIGSNVPALDFVMDPNDEVAYDLPLTMPAEPRTNYALFLAVDQRLSTAPDLPENWTAVIPERPDVETGFITLVAVPTLSLSVVSAGWVV